MPQSRRSSTTTALPWLSLRSRGLSVRLRSRTVKRLPPRPPRPRPLKRKRKRALKRLPATDPREEQDFLYGHAFDVLLALGLVPSQDRLLQETGLSRMHVMEGEDKRVEMVAESAPDLPTTKPVTEIKLTKEVEDLPPTAEQEPKLPELSEPVVKSPSPASTPVESKDEVEEPAAPEPLVNGELKEEKTDSENVVKVKTEDVCVENGKEDERTESEEKDSKEPVKEVVEVKEIGSGGCSEEEDRNSVTSSQSRKRGVGVEGEGEGSSSESDAGASKRPRLDPDDGEDERERLVREYVEEVTDSVEEMSRAADKLQREIGALGELLRAKELEWNSILRLRKLKEEMLERLLRRRRLASIMSGASGGSLKDEPISDHTQYNKGGKASSLNSLATSNHNHLSHNNHSQNHNGLMMVPIVSSSPSPGHVTSSFSRGPGGPQSRQSPAMRLQRPILPKPPPDPHHAGPVAEGRSRHPENVPRRGRRLRPHESGGGGPLRPLLLEPQPPVVSSTRISGSPALMSMANMALGSGSHVRENPQAPTPSFMGQENSRPSSVDSSRGSHLDMLPAPGLSFKDALVQFAKMSQPPPLPAKPPPPPPPYPEVTLHPVSAPHSPPPHASLLHGILTKPPPGPTPPLPHPHRATTFSPTLARLLTAPERSPHNAQHSHASHTGHSHFRPPTSTAAQRVNICEILSSSKKNRNEITITPVSGSKNKDEVVLLGEEEEEGDGDRLVIDESRDGAGTGELPETVPECQGCHQRAAQFVCAGCGNQWYCSRECQVSAWEEHSEMCSG